MFLPWSPQSVCLLATVCSSTQLYAASPVVIPFSTNGADYAMPCCTCPQRCPSRAVWCLGFGSYLLGLGTIGYNLTGGDSTPGNVGIVDATSPKNIIGFGLCIIFIGARSPIACQPHAPPRSPASGALCVLLSVLSSWCYSAVHHGLCSLPLLGGCCADAPHEHILHCALPIMTRRTLKEHTVCRHLCQPVGAQAAGHRLQAAIPDRHRHRRHDQLLLHQR